MRHETLRMQRAGFNTVYRQNVQNPVSSELAVCECATCCHLGQPAVPRIASGSGARVVRRTSKLVRRLSCVERRVEPDERRTVRYSLVVDDFRLIALLLISLSHTYHIHIHTPSTLVTLTRDGLGLTTVKLQ